MNPKKLRRHLNRLRNKAGSGLASAELERLAESLGRVRSKRGSEPTWVSELFPDLRPITIPHHSKPLARYTALSILDSLELDLERIEED